MPLGTEKFFRHSMYQPEKTGKNFHIVVKGMGRRVYSGKGNFQHGKLLLFWPVYGLCYLILERVVDPDRCHVIQCALDERIPLCVWFLIPYVFWYFCLAGICLYTLVRDADIFEGFMRYLILTSAVAVLFYLIWPSRQTLRPETVAGEGILSAGVRLLYRVDTPTNVFPSLHVTHSFGILSAGLRAKGLEAKGWKWFFGMTTVLVCLSTVFLRQHSVLDGLAALPLSAGAEWICYGGSTWVKCSKRKTV